jgi:hypothetical protein
MWVQSDSMTQGRNVEGDSHIGGLALPPAQQHLGRHVCGGALKEGGREGQGER